MFKKVPFIVFAATLTALLIQPCMPAYAQVPLPPPPSSPSQCWAVIVGVSDYERMEDVNYSDDDARELSQRLSPIWSQDHIKLLLDREATKTNIWAAVNWLVDKDSANDTVLFYFSGHGSSEGYIAPYDAYYAETWISRNELGGWLGRLDSQKAVVILDTCAAGLFEPNLSDSGRVVLMSSRADETSSETSLFGHGVFTYYILQTLGEFADTNHDYELSAEEIFQYAEPETVSFTTDFSRYRIQHPVLSDIYSGELSLLVKFIFSSTPDLPSGTVALFVDNQPYSSGSPPLIWAPGSAHDLKVPSPADTGSGTRYVFISWDDGNTSLSRTISNGGVYEAKFKTEYQLTIKSAYGEPGGEGWYQSGSPATISVASIEEATVRHIFTGWSGDFVGTETTAMLTINSAKTIKVNWRTDYTQLYILIAGIIVLVSIIIVIIVIVRIRRRI